MDQYLLEPFEIKPTNLEEEAVILSVSGEDGWLLKIYTDGRIVFNDQVKEKNPEEFAQRFIKILEQLFIPLQKNDDSKF